MFTHILAFVALYLFGIYVVAVCLGMLTSYYLRTKSYLKDE